jgi:hypothetical protein
LNFERRPFGRVHFRRTSRFRVFRGKKNHVQPPQSENE